MVSTETGRSTSEILDGEEHRKQNLQDWQKSRSSKSEDEMRYVA